MSDDWMIRRPFTPVEARELIDREGLKEAVQAHFILERQMEKEFLEWMDAHRGFGLREARRDERERYSAAVKENGRRIVLLHRVNRAIYGQTV